MNTEWQNGKIWSWNHFSNSCSQNVMTIWRVIGHNESFGYKSSSITRPNNDCNVNNVSEIDTNMTYQTNWSSTTMTNTNTNTKTNTSSTFTEEWMEKLIQTLIHLVQQDGTIQVALGLLFHLLHLLHLLHWHLSLKQVLDGRDLWILYHCQQDPERYTTVHGTCTRHIVHIIHIVPRTTTNRDIYIQRIYVNVMTIFPTTVDYNLN